VAKLDTLPKFKKLVFTVGLQPNAAISVLHSIAALYRKESHTVEHVVLIHGPDGSEEAAKAAKQYGEELQAGLGAANSPFKKIELVRIDNPFDSSIVGRARESLRSILELDKGGKLVEWHLVYGPGTVPMNVGITHLWLHSDDLCPNIWDYSERTKRLTNVRGQFVDLEKVAKVPLERIVRSRVDVSARLEKRKGKNITDDDVKDQMKQLLTALHRHKKSTQNNMAQIAKDAGPLLELAVAQVFKKIRFQLKVRLNMELKFEQLTPPPGAAKPTRPSSREIDVLVEHESGKLLLVSCVARTSNTRPDTSIRTDFRLKATEIRLLAANYFGSETKTLTVCLTRLAKHLVPSECPIVRGARFDAQIFNHPSTKHWIVTAHELLGTTDSEIDESFENPATIDGRIPGFSQWILS
jgi:hypothetical protein